MIGKASRRRVSDRRGGVPRPTTAALGLAPHSGWAALVALGEADGSLHVLVRDRIEMADARQAGSKQPYHAVEGLPIEEAERRLAAFEAEAGRMAHEALEGIAGHLAQGGHRVVGLGILESAGRKGVSLVSTLASHALIHTADGDHFRNAIAGAAVRLGQAVSRIRARELGAEAARATGLPHAALARSVATWGREVGPPWGADQKAAALLAWLVLAREAGDGRRTR